MRKHVFFFIAILCISLVCSACSAKQTATTPQEENKNSINTLDLIIPEEYASAEGLDVAPGSTFSIIVQDMDDPYWEAYEKGASQAIKDLNTLLNYTEDNEIILSYCAPREKDDIDDQVSLLDEELARFPMAVAIAPIDEKAFGVQFDLAKEDVVTALEAVSTPISLYEPVYADGGGDAVYVMDQLSDSRTDHDWLEELALKDAIKSLPEREKTILRLRFFCGLTQTEVSKHIGISQAQVSRLEKGALARIKSQL